MTQQVTTPGIPQPGPAVMSGRAKVIIIVLVVVMLLCLAGVAGCVLVPKLMGSALEKSVIIDDPAQAAQQAREIIDYRLPAGYKELAVMNVVVYKMAILGAGDSMDSVGPKPIIMIGQFADVGEMKEEDMRQQFEQGMQQAMGRSDIQLKKVADRQMTIRGQKVTVLEYVGTDENGNKLRQLITSMFEGKSGNVMVIVTGAADDWNQKDVDFFLRSIK
jgi:hypothetical protein